MKLAHVALVCRSMDNIEQFYGKVLGLEKQKDFVLDPNLTESIFGVPGECRILVYGNESTLLEIFLPEKAPKGGAIFEHICLEVRDRESFLAECERMGFPANLVPKGESLLVFVKDYDGNLFEIKELA